MSDFFTEKQKQLISIFKHGQLKRINLLEGSVRSGKTWISLVLWALWVATMPDTGAYLMVAKTLTSLRRNCLDLLTDLIGNENFKYSLSQKEGVLFGRKIYLEGVNDARAESKIRGMTLQGAYCDELTLFTEDFFSMLLSRLSMAGAKLIATTNPDAPLHWLKTNYMDRQDKLNMLTMQFLIDDNTTLPPEYVEELKKEYVGVFYQRFILGRWVMADGVVYDMYNDDKHTFDELPIDTEHRIYRRYVAIDYGTINPCVYLEIIDDTQGNYYVTRERYYNSKDRENRGRQKSDAEHADDLDKFVNNDCLRSIIIDPSAASFKIAVHSKGLCTTDADNDVLDGIRLVSTLLAQGRIHVHTSCINLRKEFTAYMWNEKRAQQGEETVLKQNDHALDALRYFIKTIVGGHRSVKK